MPIKLFTRKPATAVAESPPPPRNSQPVQVRPLRSYEPAERTALDQDPLRRLVQLERYGHLLATRARWSVHPDAKAILETLNQAIDDAFALVPEGFASIALTMNDAPGCPETDVETAPFLLARCAVTNAQFQKFIDAGGYEDLDLWPRDIWPHLIDFRDLTDEPGPRFWRHGRYDKPLADHPVVGVSYCEAAAYALWAGYRLPTEAEWQMAASWRIRSSANVLRRYPWGDALDVRKCNIWASNVGHTVPVSRYENGVAPNGVRQLIGNVWEWTSDDLIMTDAEGRPIVGDMLLKCIRGGAFDTYFPLQATSTFRSGAASMSRAHNIGFRCAMDLRTE